MAELLDQRQRLGELDRAKNAIARDLVNVQADLRDLQLQARKDEQVAIRNVSLADQDLTENEARREIWIRSPQSGIMTGVTAAPGQAVNVSQPLGTLLPENSQLEAELYAPSRSVGFIKSGMTVMIRYQAYSYQKFGQFRGEVREVSGAGMRPDELPLAGGMLTGNSSSEPLYRIRVNLDRQSVQAYGKEQPLKPGMALDASILLERRRLYEWILEPLYSVTGRV
jgi:membrane fusion protein